MASICSGYLAPCTLIFEAASSIGGVEKRDAVINGCADQRDRFLPVHRRAVREAHPHATQADGGYFEVAGTKFALLHRFSFAVHLRYCSSVTFSIHVTGLPLSFSWIAMWVMAVVAVAPCQCFSPGGNHTTSPGRISSIGPPSRCAQPQPAVTIKVWPSGCVCHAVRAPGSKVTLAPAIRAG